MVTAICGLWWAYAKSLKERSHDVMRQRDGVEAKSKNLKDRMFNGKEKLTLRLCEITFLDAGTDRSIELCVEDG